MVIDAHSHVGKDYYFNGTTLESYDDYCTRNNIDAGLLMPMPWPVFEGDDKEVCSLVWEHQNYKLINYFKLIKQGDKVVKKKVVSNPYKNVNEYYYNLIKNTKTNTKINFVPIIHGVLDEASYVESFIKTANPIALKFHGFSSGFFKDDVNPELVEVIKYYDLPIILHTSVYNYDDGYGLDTKFWRNKCSPQNWFKFLFENELRGVLNHGACLDEKTISLVNKSDNIMIGIGPDLDISLDPYKVLTPKKEYLKKGYLNILKGLVDPEKLIFDLDFNWNKDNHGNVDCGSVSRVINTWTYSDSEKILYKNAKNFYKI
jgi:hypothetical protein